MLAFVLLSAAKGRVFLAVLGMFIPFAAIVGSVQLARPHSIWARRLYVGQKLARAEHRYGPDSRLSRLGARLSDLLAGAPTETVPPSKDSAATGP